MSDIPEEIWLEPKPATWGCFLFSEVKPKNKTAVKYIRADLARPDQWLPIEPDIENYNKELNECGSLECHGYLHLKYQDLIGRVFDRINKPPTENKDRKDDE